MKKKTLWIGLVIFLLIIILVPIIIYYLVDQCNTGFNNIDKSIWLSFWGTYSGACIGGLITYFVLFNTVYQYQEESKNARDDLLKAQQIEKNRYINDTKRQLLVSVRPLIIVESIEESEPKPPEEVHRYVFNSDESRPERAKMSNYEVEKVVKFKIKNIGVGPAEDLSIKYSSSVYGISGYDDIAVSEIRENAPVLFTKMSYDISHNDYVNFKLTLHFSKEMKDSIYLNRLSFTIYFHDCRHNEMERVITVNLNSGKVDGWDEQKYCDVNNQALFDGIIE